MDNSTDNISYSKISQNSKLNYSKPISNKILAKDIIESYGSIYKTTGGSNNKVGGLYLKSWLNKLTSNRVLDLYLKYLGITTLTTSTLVPLSLIMGRDFFEESINFIISNDQKGGNFLENKIPLLDDDLIGNYLKISGLTTLTLSPHTLIPLGILMSIYSLYVSDQRGGTKLITGASIPPNIVQNLNDIISGQDYTHTPLRPLPYYNNDMQLNTFNDNYNGHIDNLQTSINVDGFPKYDISNTKVTQTIEPHSPKPIDDISINSNISGNEIHPDVPNVDLDIVTSMAGGGSDWLSTHNSRGPVNNPSITENQFRKFNQTADYISNSDLSGIDNASLSDTSSLSSHSTLYEMTPHDTIPNGYNIGGVVANNFSS
jgi:hypothetical protein